jgi:hypothetical protein
VHPHMVFNWTCELNSFARGVAVVCCCAAQVSLTLWVLSNSNVGGEHLQLQTQNWSSLYEQNGTCREFDSCKNGHATSDHTTGLMHSVSKSTTRNTPLPRPVTHVTYGDLAKAVSHLLRLISSHLSPPT